jgi:hypothetical protein
LASGQDLNLQTEIADLRDRISSNSVSIDSFIFPSLTKTVDWCVHHTYLEFNVRDEDGGKGRLCVGVADSRQHRVWEVEVVGRYCGFLVVKKKIKNII